MKKISVLGSTGSIGKQTLDVVRKSDNLKITTLSAHKNVKLLEEQIREFKPKYACMTDTDAARDLSVRIKDTNTKVLSTTDGICECMDKDDSETVVTAIVGIAGLKPTLSAIRNKKRIALANKETLVTAGSIVMQEAKENNVAIIPVDSEHSAIFQSISNQREYLKKIIITASGGPFFGKKREELSDITVKEALNHPNWSMGAKITIDSATLVNKGLEIIEAMHLFNITEDMIEPVIHRESIIHSMVEFCDGSVIAQLGVPDMRLPISYAINYPERTIPVTEPLDIVKAGKLTFFDVDNKTFPAINLARRAIREGGIMCVVYNGANEAAVDLFLNGKCKFTDICRYIEKAMDKTTNIINPTIEDIFNADNFARTLVKECD